MDTSTAEQTINDVAAKLGLTIKTVFVPFSQSRSKNEKDPSLNWIVTLLKNNKPILTTDYMAGCGNCPSYEASVKQLGNHNSIMRDDAIRQECESGKKYLGYYANIGAHKTGKKLEPKLANVLYSLCLDSDVINYGTFEEWARDLGYDPDSRSGEKIYRSCLEISLKLRNGLGDEGLKELCEACNNY